MSRTPQRRLGGAGIRRGLRAGVGVGTGAAPPPPFSPADLSGLVSWYRADLGVTINVPNGSTVSQWADQSPTANPVVQATAASQPPYVAADTDGLPSVDFNTTSKTMRYVNHANYASSAWTLALWIYQTGGLADATYVSWSQHSGTSNTSRFALQYVRGSSGTVNNFRVLIYGTSGNYMDDSDFTTRLDKWTHVIVSYDPSLVGLARLNVYFNGVAQTITATPLNTPASSTADLRINGQNNGVFANVIKVDDLIAVNRVITSEERDNLLTYRPRSPT